MINKKLISSIHDQCRKSLERLAFFVLANDRFRHKSTSPAKTGNTPSIRYRLVSLRFLWALAALPAGFESYSTRPSIQSIEARQHHDVPFWTPRLVQAHFDFVAMLFALYPDSELYFLARDAEYLYDSAILMTEKTRWQNRLHLLNVTRDNIKDPHVVDYLEQEGISFKSLSQGKNILFVDSGLLGSIPKAIGELFPEGTRSQIRTHLLASNTSLHPSSRLFLLSLNPVINLMSSRGHTDQLATYEAIAHFTDRSTHYFKVGERWHPISSLYEQNDGRVSKELAQKSMEYLKAHAPSPSYFWEQVHLVRRILRMLKSGSPADVSSLKKLMHTENSNRIEAIIRDLIEAQMNIGRLPITLQQLDLFDPPENFTKKDALIKTNPEWTWELAEPQSSIPHLVEQKNWSRIKALILADVSQEVNEILIETLFAHPDNTEVGDVLKFFIEKANPKSLSYLSVKVFSKPIMKNREDLLLLLIERGDQSLLQKLVLYTFVKPHTQKMTAALKRLVERASPFTLAYVSKYVLSLPHTQNSAEHERLREAVPIQDPEARKLFLNRPQVSCRNMLDI